jgi:hypothetical protein
MVRHKLPNFRFHNGSKILHATIIHYKGNKYVVTMKGLVMSQGLARSGL